MLKQLMCLLFIAVLVTNDAAGEIYQRRGSTVGGLTGAAVGAAIGEHNNKPLAGGIIGGVVGLVSGAAMRNARDREIAESRADHQYQQQQSLA